MALEGARRDLGRRTEPGARGLRFTWEMIDEGNDARLLSGKHSGKTVRELVEDEAGREYLGWLYRVAPDGLRNIIEGYFPQ